MKRRDFLKAGAVAAVALNFDDLQAALNSNTMIAQTAPDLVAVMGGEPEAMLDKALEALGGIGNYVKRGQKIAIKPNIGWDRKPELGACTNPELVGALVKKCLAAGASKVTVFDHTCDDWRKCYASSGIEAAVKAAGGTMMPGNDVSYFSTEISLPKGVRLKTAKIHDALIEADAWINVPVLKNHEGPKMTCAMKNLMGIVPNPSSFHRNNLDQCIADICTWEKKPVLNIVDAYRVMFRNGPQGKSAADTTTAKALLASTDIVAIDTAALQLYNQVEKLELEAVQYLGMGQALRIGTTDLNSLNIQRIRI